MSCPITVPLSRHDAALVALALGYFIRQRDEDIKHADLLSPDIRAQYISDCHGDQLQAKDIRDRIDVLLGVRPAGGAR